MLLLIYTVDGTGNSKASGVMFEMEKNCWVPDSSCTSEPIPKAFPEAAAAYARHRQQMSLYVSNDNNNPIFLSGGYMSGPDCIPLTPLACTSCSAPTSTSTVLQDNGVFVLRTYYGAVLRRRYSRYCACGHVYPWNPADEYIHAIKNNTEGGT